VSAENVELHRGFHEAFNARDLEGWIAYCDPGIEFTSSFASVEAPAYGHDAMRRWRRGLDDAWDQINIEPDAYFDLGDRTLAFYNLRGRGRHSGLAVAMPIAQVSSWRDGRMTRFRSYLERGDALGDLGVSEDELEPIAP
jgi:ketosteroid isomerase-like protein